MYLGQCLCGEVNVRINGEISDIIHCHCSLCRKNSGTAFATNGFINTADFEVISGESKLSTFSFKPGRNRHFCSFCGLGLLDSFICEKPISHNFVSSKASWEDQSYLDMMHLNRAAKPTTNAVQA